MHGLTLPHNDNVTKVYADLQIFAVMDYITKASFKSLLIFILHRNIWKPVLAWSGRINMICTELNM